MGNEVKKVLITGGMGFVGQHLLKILIEKYEGIQILILDKRRPSFFISSLENSKQIKIVDNIDLLDIGSIDNYFEGVDYVIHVAALISFWRKDKKALYDVNINGTQNVIDLCKKHNIKRLVYVSSTASIGFNNKKDELTTEEFKYDWKKGRGFHYMLSKHYAEERVKVAAKEGLDAVIANPSSMFGPGDKKFFPLAEMVNSNSVPGMLPGGFSITDVRDTANALAILLEEGKAGENYLIIGGNYTYKQMFTQLAQKLNAPIPTKQIPKIAGYILVPLISFIELLLPKPIKLTREILAPGFKYRYYSNEKAIRELGWKPNYTLEHTFTDAIDFYTNYQKGIEVIS